MRGWALVLAFGLAGCQPGPTSGPSHSLVQRCTAASGFTARAADARAAGVEGEVLATPAELAATNACVRGSRPVAGSYAVGRTAPRSCALEMVGGSGYRCASSNRR